jgi:hypothetical protein
MNIFTFYSVEILYDGDAAGSVDRWTKKNLTGIQFKELRENIWFAGLYVPSEECPGTEGEIISPYRIRKFYVSMQQTKWKE